MNTIEDLGLSNISYTSKDFASLYQEELDIAKQLTNKWDPSHSNESDPGVVLLKEAAFVGDHNNYNIDKNILEAFLPSATQDISTRNIVEMNGYTPRYYVSATGDVTLVWNGESEVGFTIPAFTLVITNSDGDVAYTQAEDIAIIGNGIKSKGRFIEGTLQSLTVNNDNTIRLSNLDDNNRIYFPESKVAQNGLYVKNKNKLDYADYWKRDNYLLTKPVGSRVYKIDYDSDKGLPYIEFPSDIASLIGDGLVINYISTSGIEGNVSAKTLNEIQSPTTFIDMQGAERESKELVVYNAGSIFNGKDPETIDEMYQSFKKVVGTFDTLVTCKDYSNYIYTNEQDLVSNCHVEDRRTDYNKSVNVVSYDSKCSNEVGFLKNLSTTESCLRFRGSASSQPSNAEAGDLYVINNSLKCYNGREWIDANTINLNDFSILTAAMTPYDLIIYCLRSFSMAEYSDIYFDRALNNSFLPVTDENSLYEIKTDLESSKCISHTYKDPNSDDIFIFKNYLPLEVYITPFKKVNLSEKLEIIDNVRRSLTENFNAHNLEFGEKLNPESVRNVIVNADERIKSIELMPFIYTPKAELTNGSEVELNGTIGSKDYTLLTDLVSKNILAGRICLFDFDDRFEYSYGQVDCDIAENITSITTELPLQLKNGESREFNSTGKITNNKYFVNTEKDLKYIFNVPSFKDNYHNRKNLDNNETSYELKAGDIISIIEDGVKKDYKTTSSEKITVTNGLSSLSLVNDEEEHDVPSNLNNGYIGISVFDVDKANEGIENLNYTLRENEVFQIIYPNYYSDYSYGMYVNYRYEGTSIIKANTEHTLSGSEKIILLYTNDGVTQQKVIRLGEIVNCSFDLVPTDNVQTATTQKEYNDNGSVKIGKFKSLSSNQTIATRQLMKTKLSSKNIQCYWIVNKNSVGSYTLFNSGSKERILNDGEYFIYSNASLDEIMILGVGTKLERSTLDDDADWTYSTNPLSIEAISENGTSLDVGWRAKDFSENPFYITEMNLISLGKGDNIVLGGVDIEANNMSSINNNFTDWAGLIEYTANGESTTLPSGNKYQVRSRLDINAGPGQEQKIEKGQKVIVNSKTKEDVMLQCSNQLNVAGGANIGIPESDLYFYKKEDTPELSFTIPEDSAGYKEYKLFNINNNSNKNYLIPIYIEGNEVKVNVEIKCGSKSLVINDYNTDKPGSTKIVLDGNNLYTLVPKLGSTEYNKNLTIKISWDKPATSPEIVTLMNFKVVDGLNSELRDIDLDKILKRIKGIIKNSDKPSTKPYYTNKPDNSSVINNLDFKTGNTLWDKNNIANRITLPFIDLKNSMIDIVSEMRNY